MPVVLTDLSINLQSKTISDTYRAKSLTEPTLGEIITGNIDQLDYNNAYGPSWAGFNYSFTVDSYDHDESTGLYDINGSNNIADKLNYELSGEYNTDYAMNITRELFSKLGISDITTQFNHNYRVSGFYGGETSSGNYSYNETYSSALEKIFGWTDIIPNTLINVFVRGNKAYCMERGCQAGPPAILEETKCSRPIITRKKMNLIYSSSRNQYLYGAREDMTLSGHSDAAQPESYITGSFVEDGISRTYLYGLLKEEHSETSTITEDITYDYGTVIYPPANLMSKTSTKNETKVVEIPTLTESDLPYRVVTNIINESTLTNTFATNGIDLAKTVETITVTTQGYNIADLNNTQVAFPDEVETTITETRYSDMGQGLWAVVVYKNDVLVSNQTITNNPGAKATPFAVKQNSTYGGRRNKVTVVKALLPGKFNGNNQINVSDASTVEYIRDKIVALNGKVEERVRLTYYGRQKCEFWSYVSFRNNNYEIESNQIVQTPKGTSQQLELVRWY